MAAGLALAVARLDADDGEEVAQQAEALHAPQPVEEEQQLALHAGHGQAQQALGVEAGQGGGRRVVVRLLGVLLALRLVHVHLVGGVVLLRQQHHQHGQPRLSLPASGFRLPAFRPGSSRPRPFGTVLSLIWLSTVGTVRRCLCFVPLIITGRWPMGVVLPPSLPARYQYQLTRCCGTRGLAKKRASAPGGQEVS